jgi:selT/selW/selH-like putative selenoprotein
MAEEIFEEFGRQYEVLLIPSTGGLFEVTVGDSLVYSKKETQRHADYESDVAPHLRG